LRINDLNRSDEATDLFGKILIEVPGWALANAGYAEVLVLFYGEPDNCLRAPAHAGKAIELVGSIAEHYLVLGLCRQYYWDWEAAEQAYRKAIQIDPELAVAHHDYGIMLDLQRRFSEAETSLKRAIDLEPFSPYFHSSLCQHYYYDKKFDKALEHCFEARRIDPAFWRITKLLHWIYAVQGRYDEILKLKYSQITEAERSRDPFAKALSEGNIRKYWQLGLRERMTDRRKPYSPFSLATYHAHLGDAEKTLEFLEKSLELPRYDLRFANPDPRFDTVRRDIRFVELMRKINLDP
jgi:serine/threonine-protein kinase